MSKKTEATAMSFETALTRLEEIVNLLENGNAGLDDALAVFEEGVGLVKLCNAKLNAAEQKVRVVTLGADGQTGEEALAPLEKR